MAFPLTSTVELQLSNVNLFKVVADTRHIDTSALGRCEISTSISNIEYGSYSSHGETHEACVVFFCFEMAGQRKSGQRIKELDIVLSVFRAQLPDVDIPTARGSAPTGNHPKALEIRFREPKRGRTASSHQRVSSKVNIGGQIGYQSIGVNSGYTTSKEQDVSDCGSFESIPRNKRTVAFRLKENAMLKDGVPPTLNCAIVLRTDGIPFSIQAEFTAILPHLGSFFTKKAIDKVLIEESSVQRGHDSEDRAELKNMDSTIFMEWIKRHELVQNEWMI